MTSPHDLIVCSSEWLEKTEVDWVLLSLVCLRMLLRDAAFLQEFFNVGGVKGVAQVEACWLLECLFIVVILNISKSIMQTVNKEWQSPAWTKEA